MNKQPARGAEVEAATETSIADYLQSNPDFFERHSSLLTKLQLPHARGAATVSLVERQVLVLREKNEKLESRLRELIEVARANDVLATKIHRLAGRLIRGDNATTLIDSLETSLREDFGASEWLILLAVAGESEFSKISSRHLRVIDPAAAELKMFETLFESARPRCGQIRDSQRNFLFGADSVEIGSAALVPLGSQPSFGLLAISSPDTERFHPTMSTDFLARIGDLVSEAIAVR
ncbi:MAG TPA: DUF484 family protein [Steroidobacteraceae bacterium]|jgi:hypothetical protein